MAHRCLLSTRCRSAFLRLLASRRVTCWPAGGQLERGRGLLSDMLGGNLRLSSIPPKGFEKYFPGSQKTPKNTEAEAETKDAKPANDQGGGGSGGSGRGGGKRGGGRDDSHWYTRLQKVSVCFPEGSISLVPEGSISLVPEGSISLVPEGSISLVPEGSISLVPEGSISLVPEGSISMVPEGSISLLQ
ncbi:hypothetical protein OYC64_017407 [Pagothenia borchgrevinki]|uniref:Uncharacterized protein n=1 Tax=Pagothenia borchgrevinki TaxID=8213 RepID=A0ABD2GKN9_PAGBO